MRFAELARPASGLPSVHGTADSGRCTRFSGRCDFTANRSSPTVSLSISLSATTSRQTVFSATDQQSTSLCLLSLAALAMAYATNASTES
ncbi:hypothetical protein C8039_12650 [Halogeometricum sp. wsp3]|nr:hypothetical protein C8039_12650 [Halogeometricum sp. wsp3]